MPTLNQRIADFYDTSTQLWLDVWGEHMHHGYYTDQSKSHAQAQIDLIERLLDFGGVSRADQILDIGCGVGGSARYLARKYDAQVLGVTLSPVQAARAADYNKAAGLEHRVHIKVQDMMTVEAEATYDLIWSMESAEHIADKPELLANIYRWLKPGGRFVMATWCTRDTPPALTGSEQRLLQRIYDLYHLPPMVSVDSLQRMAHRAGLEQVTTDEWSQAVAPFWKAVIQSALKWSSVRGLLKAGWPTIKGAWAMRYMTKGFKQGVLKFGVMSGRKPLDS